MYAGVVGRRNGERVARSLRKESELLSRVSVGMSVSSWMLTRRPRCDGVETRVLKEAWRACDAEGGGLEWVY